VCFLYVLARFPGFLQHVKEEGAKPDVVVRLTTFYHLNVSLFFTVPNMTVTPPVLRTLEGSRHVSFPLYNSFAHYRHRCSRWHRICGPQFVSCSLNANVRLWFLITSADRFALGLYQLADIPSNRILTNVGRFPFDDGRNWMLHFFCHYTSCKPLPLKSVMAFLTFPIDLLPSTRYSRKW